MFQPGLSLGQIVKAVTRLLIGRAGRSRESDTNSITTNRNSVQSCWVLFLSTPQYIMIPPD